MLTANEYNENWVDDEMLYTATNPKLVKGYGGVYLIKVRCREWTYTLDTETKNKAIAEAQVGLFVECIEKSLELQEERETVASLRKDITKLWDEKRSLKEEIASLKKEKNG